MLQSLRKFLSEFSLGFSGRFDPDSAGAKRFVEEQRRFNPKPNRAQFEAGEAIHTMGYNEVMVQAGGEKIFRSDFRWGRPRGCLRRCRRTLRILIQNQRTYLYLTNKRDIYNIKHGLCRESIMIP